MKGTASEASVPSLHRAYAPQRPNTSQQGSETGATFEALLGTRDSEPRERPEAPAPRDPPRQSGFVRNKPAARETVRASDSSEPARADAATDTAPVKETKDTAPTGEGEKVAKEKSTEGTGDAEATVAEATNTTADQQPTTPAAVAVVMPAQVVAPTEQTTGEVDGEAAIAAPATPALVPAEEVADNAEEGQQTAAKPTMPEQKGAQKAEQTQTAPQAGTKQAAEGGEESEHKDSEKKDGQPAQQTEAKHAKAAPDAELRFDTPRADTNAAPARTGAEQTLPLTQPAHQTAASAQAAAAAQAPAATANAVPVNGVAIEIAAQSRAGNNRFEIRLDPPELGRINVRLDIDRDGNVSSHLIVDRVETLDMLRRDAGQLERALEQAGLKTSDNGLQFSLRDQSPQHRQQQDNNPHAAQLIVAETEIPEVAQRHYGRLLGLGSGLDIRV